MRYLIQVALMAALATGLALAQSSSSSQSQQPSSSGSQSQTAPSSTQPDQTQTQPSTTQPSTPDKDKDTTGQQTSKMPQGEAAASSTDVESTIQQAIQKDPSLSSSNIQVKASNKDVTLSGTVNSDDEKKTAEQIAKSNAGTRKVKNHIKVKSASSTAPSTSATPK